MQSSYTESNGDVDFLEEEDMTLPEDQDVESESSWAEEEGNHAVKHEALSTGKHLSDYNQQSNEYSKSRNRGNQHDSQLPEEWLNVPDWPASETPKLGQVSGVTINSKGEVLVFHRVNHVWNGQAFDVDNNYLQRERGPISTPTVLVYDPESGAVIQQWGENMFYMPHGISVDHEDNLWLTDVALHQVFKFPPLHKNPKSPYLQLGIAFKPGNSAEQFCKPTSVAVAPSGDFFVADGYCNSRIVKFNSAGEKISEWGRSTIIHGYKMPDPYHMEIPHALTLAEDKGLVCVADRENGRVQCFDWHNGTFAYQLYSSKFGSRVFSVTYSPLQGGMFFLVNGPEMKQFPVDVRGFVVSASTKQPISMFGFDLQNPHDIAVSADGMDIYVAEIGPLKISKYTRNTSFSPVPTASQAFLLKSAQTIGLRDGQGSVLPAVLVVAAALIFAGAILIGVLVYSRVKRRGCGHCGGRRWMLGRSPAEGFKLGHLLGQHQGFEKLSTAEESEEEVAALQPFA